MSEIKILSKVETHFEVLLKLSEDEARALDAICGYGPDAFIKWFYANLGKHYLKPHETAMRSLFSTVQKELGFRFHDIKIMRQAINDNVAKLNQKIPI